MPIGSPPGLLGPHPTIQRIEYQASVAVAKDQEQVWLTLACSRPAEMKFPMGCGQSPLHWASEASQPVTGYGIVSKSFPSGLHCLLWILSSHSS